MATITELIEGTGGLVAYLEAKTSDDWGSYSIKPYTFRTPVNKSGYRLPSFSPLEMRPDSLKIQQDFIIGKIIPFSTMPTSVQVTEYAIALARYCLHWGRCASGVFDLEVRSARFDRDQIKDQSGHSATAYWWVLQLDGSFTYIC